MVISYKYTLLLSFLLIGSIYASEQKSTKCDRVGPWIKQYYSFTPREYGYDRNYELSYIKQKPLYSRIWSSLFKRKPNVTALYAPHDKQTFSPDIIQKMDEVLIPIAGEENIRDHLPTREELKESYTWEKNPYKLFWKFSDRWANIIDKHIDKTAIACPIEKRELIPLPRRGPGRFYIDKPIPYGSPEYYKLLQNQEKQIKKEQEIVSEAIKELDITQKALMKAQWANEKLVDKTKEDLQNCAGPICTHLHNSYRKAKIENQQIQENINRTYDVSQSFWDRKGFLHKALRNIQQEKKILMGED